MRAVPLVLLMLAAAIALAPAAPAAAPEATGAAEITLVVSGEQVFPFDLLYEETSTSASCEMRVDAGATGGEILDQASEEDCISSWDYEVFGANGRFVQAIDGLEGHCPAWPLLCSFWRFDLNGSPSDTGIDFYSANDGDQLLFHYDRGAFEPVQW